VLQVLYHHAIKPSKNSLQHAAEVCEKILRTNHPHFGGSKYVLPTAELKPISKTKKNSADAGKTEIFTF